jgi:hypothetical protein
MTRPATSNPISNRLARACGSARGSLLTELWRILKALAGELSFFINNPNRIGAQLSYLFRDKATGQTWNWKWRK